MSRRTELTHFAKYAALQIPGIVIAATVLFALERWLDWPAWLAPVGLALWIGHDLIMYPFVRRAFEDGEPRVGAAALVGQIGLTVEALEPRGYVRIGGELWRAELAKPDAPLPRDVRVRVCGIDGLWLMVEPDP